MSGQPDNTRPATFIRCFESVMADTPLADRWDVPTAEQIGQQGIDDIADMMAAVGAARRNERAEKYGEDGK